MGEVAVEVEGRKCDLKEAGGRNYTPYLTAKARRLEDQMFAEAIVNRRGKTVKIDNGKDDGKVADCFEEGLNVERGIVSVEMTDVKGLVVEPPVKDVAGVRDADVMRVVEDGMVLAIAVTAGNVAALVVSVVEGSENEAEDAAFGREGFVLRGVGWLVVGEGLEGRLREASGCGLP